MATVTYGDRDESRYTQEEKELLNDYLTKKYGWGWAREGIKAEDYEIVNGEVRPKSPATDANEKKTEDRIRKELGWNKKVYKENQAALQDMIDRGREELSAAGEEADKLNFRALADYIKAEAAMEGVSPAKYVGDAKSKAAGARADRGSIQAQRQALAELQRRSRPELTDSERAIMELNRRRQEQTLRSQREAALSQQRARGFGGSGQAFQAGLAAQQEAANRRMLEDLSASGMAIDRSQQALRDYGGLAGQMRGQSFGEAFQRGTAADDIARFNNTLQMQNRQFNRRLQQQENRDAWGRQSDIAGAKFGAVADRYGHRTAPTYFESDLTKTKVGQPSSAVGQGYGKMAGNLAAWQAYRDLNQPPDYQKPDDDPGGIFGGSIIPGLL